MIKDENTRRPSAMEGLLVFLIDKQNVYRNVT